MQPFNEITQLTDVQEGTIVRAITRLDETCREVRDAARVIGDAALYQKMEACQAAIKRDIVLWVVPPFPRPACCSRPPCVAIQGFS